MLLANGISAGGFFGVTLTICLIINLIATTMESVVIRLSCKVKFSKCFGLVFLANIVSTIGGFFVRFFIEVPFTQKFSSLEYCFKYAPAMLMTLICIYWVKSVILELGVLSIPKIRRNFDISTKKFLLVIIAANIFSYLLIGWMYYDISNPMKTNLSYVDSTSGITQCTDTIIFTGKDGQLWKICADGSSLAKIPNELKASSYLASANGNVIVFYNADNGYGYYDHNNGKISPIDNILNSESEPFCNMDISPDADKIAVQQNKTIRIISLAANEPDLNIPDIFPSGKNLFWVDNNTLVKTYHSDKQLQLKINGNTVEKTELETSIDPPLKQIGLNRELEYGSKYKKQPRPQSIETKTEFYYDFLGNQKITATNDKWTPVKLRYAPYGVWPNYYTDSMTAQLLSSGNELILATDFENIYIISFPQKTIAKLIEGRDPVVCNSLGRVELTFN